MNSSARVVNERVSFKEEIAVVCDKSSVATVGKDAVHKLKVIHILGGDRVTVRNKVRCVTLRPVTL